MKDYDEIEDMIQDVKPSMLVIQNQKGQGTGFVISPKGHIITCSHVAEDEDNEIFSQTGERWTVPLLARDRTKDLAVLKIDGLQIPEVCFADPSSLAEGQKIFALGHHRKKWICSKKVILILH